MIDKIRRFFAFLRFLWIRLPSAPDSWFHPMILDIDSKSGKLQQGENTMRDFDALLTPENHYFLKDRLIIGEIYVQNQCWYLTEIMPPDPFRSFREFRIAIRYKHEGEIIFVEEGLKINGPWAVRTDCAIGSRKIWVHEEEIQS